MAESFKVPTNVAPKALQDYMAKQTARTEIYQTDEWTITATKHHILSMQCEHSEEKRDAKCETCRYNALDFHSLPDMVFSANEMRLMTGDAYIVFDTFTAIKMLGDYETDKRIQVHAATEWAQARKHHGHMLQRVIGNNNWTYTPRGYDGIVEGFRIEATDEKIDNNELRKREPIDFYEQVHLFEDELDDHGCTQLTVRVRSMPSGWLCACRYFLRVDDVMLEIEDTRLRWRRGERHVLKEHTLRRAWAQEWTATIRERVNNADELALLLPIVQERCEKLHY